MNRRTAIRKAFGVGAAAVSLPVLAKVATAAEIKSLFVGQDSCYGGPSGSIPTPVLPPPDTRTPEQVLADQRVDMVNDAIRYLTREPDQWSRRSSWGFYPEDYVIVQAALNEQGIPYEARMVNNAPALVGANGNFIRRINAN